MLVPTADLKRFGLSWAPHSVVRLSKSDNQKPNLQIPHRKNLSLPMLLGRLKQIYSA